MAQARAGPSRWPSGTISLRFENRFTTSTFRLRVTTWMRKSGLMFTACSLVPPSTRPCCAVPWNGHRGVTTLGGDLNRGSPVCSEQPVGSMRSLCCVIAWDSLPEDAYSLIQQVLPVPACSDRVTAWIVPTALHFFRIVDMSIQGKVEAGPPYCCDAFYKRIFLEHIWYAYSLNIDTLNGFPEVGTARPPIQF